MANIVISTAIAVGTALLQRALTPDTVTKTEGARLANSQITGAAEGAAVAEVYHKIRVGGQLIWTTTFREEVVATETVQGGKGGPRQITEETNYLYYASFAIGITRAEGDVLLGTVYFDGAAINLADITYRFYDGNPTQLADPKIESVEGAENTPAYRGLCYIVFEELLLTNYGNRLPAVTVEVTRLVPDTNPDSLRNNLRSVCMIPASGEFALATEVVTKEDGDGNSTPVNIHTPDGTVNVVKSLDVLEYEAPNVDSVSLVVAWFGSSIDATVCTVKPKVETSTAVTEPVQWRVSDRTRATADVVPADTFGNPIYGGTPSDLSVRQTMQDIKARGMRAVFYPFILMDSEGFPWRGRIEGNGANLVGTATPAHFGAWNGEVVPYSGPTEWTLRRMILHYARLMADILVSGDAFLVGTEMVGLTNTYASWGTKLVDLIADVRSILPAGVKVSYAADWSEYKGAVLSAVWASADFVGIDNYLPLTDWRDGDEIYNIDEFMAGIEGGEYWDYYYLDFEDREDRVQTPITDAIYRQKDIRSWSIANHPTKPIWFTEFGCPALDKGANQPNVFYDPKSTESFFPYFSSGLRNDAVQRLYLEAMLKYWGDDGFVDPANMFVWTWDARPYPSFPALTDVWSDGDNWFLGHWITGRVNSLTLDRLVRLIMHRAGFTDADIDVTSLRDSGVQVEGFGIFEVMTSRAILENLMTAYLFDVFEDGDVFRFVMCYTSDTVSVDLDDLIRADGGDDYEKSRVQDTDLPDRTKVSYLDAFRDYASASVDGHTVTGYSQRVNEFSSMSVMQTGTAKALADTLTQERWIAKNGVKFSLPLNFLRVQPGDTIPLTIDGVTRKYRVERIVTGDQLDIEGVGYSAAIYKPNYFPEAVAKATIPTAPGSPLMVFADIPLADETSPALWSPRVVATQNPWPGGVNIYEDDDDGGNRLNLRIDVPAKVGVTVNDLPTGMTGVWDRGNDLTVRLFNPASTLVSASELAVLNGANTLAVLTPSGDWEILQYRTATLNLDGTYTLRTLLRGSLGTEGFMGSPTPAGSRIIAFDPTRWSTLAGSSALMNTVMGLRVGPIGIDPSDGRYRDVDVTPRGVALRPYAPVHLTQVKEAGGDITLSWTRRTRFGGDDWGYDDVPLNETSERYDVVITGGRTLSVVGGNSVSYTLANQVADFGSGQASVGWTIYQISNLYGRGAPANG
jgi:hypothetical protein